jgi:hypothetical protein
MIKWKNNKTTNNDLQNTRQKTSLNNKNLTNEKWTQVLRKSKQFLFHM